ncbi:TPA: hypothetical protein RI751_001785 [Vibrio cholerae]|uniref:TIGR02642 family protein n=1 Tax=Vibrio cholerae TaxID=666 RepID=UPI00028C50DD|nr:TIGR02642 family protein [Vibrio cholerae]AOY45570.1 hypothetical protein NH62_10347 [Vibrio cholerae]AOY49177.1 hypothetical protein AP033_10350 [Vibrio cholerae]EGQ9965941.1 hypothetical protein [Vibrio cholerae]EHQ2334159.1 hypothetical protein [Vibrio cholerae]EJL6591452.1 hypothetical protein [Vibrio cholerae]
MSKKLELLTLLSAARTMKWEESVSKNGPTKEQLLGAMGLAQRDNPIGMAILNAKYLHCAYSLVVLRDFLGSLEVHRLEISLASNELKHLHYLAMADVLNVPIDSQQARLASVWRRYSAYAARTQKSIEALSKAMRSMERAIEIKTNPFESRRLQANIASHQTRIDAQKQLLADYAQKKAAESAKCPRCKATGVIPKTQRPCESCDGVGEFRTTEADWKASFLGAALPAHRELIIRHWPAIVHLLQEWRTQLYRHEAEALSTLEKRLSAEFED